MVTQTEVAKHLDLTECCLRDLQKLPGAPKTRKRGEYDIDDGGDDYEEKLLIARWQLTAEQAVIQQLNNQESEGKLIDAGFCIFALSKLAMVLSGTFDSIPLSIQ